MGAVNFAKKPLTGSPSIRVNCSPVPFARWGFIQKLLPFGGEGIGEDTPFVGICPGAARGPAKAWPVERFAAVCDRLAERQGRVFVLLGTGADAPAARRVAGKTGARTVDLAGKTDLRMLGAVAERCTLVVSNDSGAMHVAAATGTPVVGLFLSTDPERTGPRGPRHEVVRAAVACRPCMKGTCPGRDYECLDAVTVDEVVAACERALSRSALSRKPLSGQEPGGQQPPGQQPSGQAPGGE